VRIALGGQAPRVVAEIFRGPFIQVCTGVVAGSVAVVVLVWMATGATSLMPADGLRLLALGAGVVVVTAIACLGPTRRALRVEPVKALSSGD
jgi:ABC-type antimicrobial peptide transport system permease subunit